MNREDIIKIAADAARRIKPSMGKSIEQMEKSANPEIKIGVEAMKRTMARHENIIIDAIHDALLLQSGEKFLELAAAHRRVEELEAALGMLTTWAKKDIDEPEGDFPHLFEEVIEHARNTLNLDNEFNPIA